MPILDQYKKGLKPLIVEEWLDLAIYRPLGFVFALPLSKTAVTPNQVTFLSTLAGVLGAVAIGFGTYDWLVWGAALYMLSNVWDCTDGQLARITQKFSRYGRIYDGVADYVVGLATFIAIGVAWKPDGYTNFWWWVLLLSGGIVCTAYQGMFLNHVRQAYLHTIEHNDKDKKVVHRGKKKKKGLIRNFFYAPFFYLYRAYLNIERTVRKRVRLPLELTPELRETTGLRIVLRLWTFTGKGTHVTLLALFMFLGKPEYYLWFCLIPLNIYILVVWICHQFVLKDLLKKMES